MDDLDRRPRWTPTTLAAATAFLLLSALIMATVSERVYWYLGGLGPQQNLGIAAFYLLPVLVAMWAAGNGPSAALHQLIFVAGLYAMVVEGVLTPTVYEDGPLPVLALLFLGWHGVFALVGAWFFVRRLLLDRRRKRLALGASLVGLLWGGWSIVYRAPDVINEDPVGHAPMEPAEFAGYALVVGLLFVAAHWLIGHVWPARFRLGRFGQAITVIVAVGYSAFAVLPAVPWAPLKFAVLVGGLGWLLHLSRHATPGEPSVIETLRGTVRLRDAGLLLLAPAVASLTYAVLWSQNPGAAVSQAVYAVGSLIQIVTGLVAMLWAVRELARRRRNRSGS